MSKSEWYPIVSVPKSRCALDVLSMPSFSQSERAASVSIKRRKTARCLLSLHIWMRHISINDPFIFSPSQQPICIFEALSCAFICWCRDLILIFYTWIHWFILFFLKSPIDSIFYSKFRHPNCLFIYLNNCSNRSIGSTKNICGWNCNSLVLIWNYDRPTNQPTFQPPTNQPTKRPTNHPADGQSCLRYEIALVGGEDGQAGDPGKGMHHLVVNYGTLHK